MRRRSLLVKLDNGRFEPDANTIELFHLDANFYWNECNTLTCQGNSGAGYSQVNALCPDGQGAIQITSGTFQIPSFTLPSNCTIEFWMQSTNTEDYNWKVQLRPCYDIGSTSYITKYDGNQAAIMVSQYEGNLYFTHPNGTNHLTTYPSTSAHHVAIVRESSTLKFFVDGEKVKEVTFIGTNYSYWTILFNNQAIYDELRVSNVVRYS